MINEIPDTFLADFGVVVTWGVVSALGILDEPDTEANGLAISGEYSLLVRNSIFSGVGYSDAITVDGNAYTVKDIRRLDDGVFSRISLSKVTP